jgi:hypothetical protein
MPTRVFASVNVAFHELVGIAIAQETGARLGTRESGKRAPVAWTVAFVLAVLSHGILDALPHYYPLPSAVDGVVSITLVAAWLLLVPRWMRWPLFAIGFGALLPDIVDHLPKDLHRHLHLDLPVLPNLFPWHWRTDSGSLTGRTGPLWRESLTNHLIVLAFCATAILRTRHLLRGPRPPIR